MLGTHFGFVAANVDLAGLVVPRRDAVAPPQLAADAPVLDVTHPGEVHVLVLLGHELDAAIFHGSDGRFCQRLGGNVPLVGQPRLDDSARTVTFRYFQGVVVNAHQQALGVQVGNDLLARDEAVEVGVLGRQAGVDLLVDAAVEVERLGTGQHEGVLVEDVQQWQVVALADFIVVEVVSRGDLHAAGTELGVAVVVGDDRDAAADQRQFDELADQCLVAFVVRVDRNGCVTQQGFRTGGGDDR